MTWFLAAFISAFAITGQFYGMKKLQRHYPINQYMTYTWFIAGSLLCLSFVRLSSVTLITLFMLAGAGLFSWLGMLGYNLAIRGRVNIGYVDAISNLRTVLLYFFSILFFQADYDALRFIALVLALLGILIVGFPKKKIETPNDLNWIFWSFFSGLSFVVFALLSKAAIVNGANPNVAAAIVIFVSGLFFLIPSFAQKSFKLPRKAHFFIVLFTIFCIYLGNRLLFLSYDLAPNLAYPAIISNTRMVYLYLLSILFLGEKVDRIKLVGIIMIFIAISFLI